jgi:GNAT superfamily N-acetyltransferase
MEKIIKQIENNAVYNVVTRIHDKDDVQDGDLVERLEEYEYYNHIKNYKISNFDLNSYDVDQDKVEDIIDQIKENGIETMPKIVVDENDDIIDGLHRLNALHQLGYTEIDILKGTNEKFNQIFKKELIDKDLEIYQISNEFGSISIMENAKFSPADNSVFEFLVNEEYRGLGIGTELLKEAMNQYQNLGAQVSSMASLKVFLECGFEPKNLTNKNKFSLDPISYDFKTFNKSPELLEGNAAMYRTDLNLFNDKMIESKDLFKQNGQSLYMEDKRLPVIDLSNKKRNKFKI